MKPSSPISAGVSPGRPPGSKGPRGRQGATDPTPPGQLVILPPPGRLGQDIAPIIADAAAGGFTTASLLNAAYQFLSGASQDHGPPPMYPVAVNVATGEVTVLIPQRDMDLYNHAVEATTSVVGRNRLPGYLTVSNALEHADDLQAIFDGQTGRAGSYEYFRNDLAILGVDFRRSQPEPSPFEPPPNFPALFSGGGRQYSPVGPEDFFMPRFVRDLPVGGYAGFAQQTVAGQLSSMPRSARSSVRRRKARRSSARTRSAGPTRRRRTRRARVARRGVFKRAARRRGGLARLKKGSAAAKRYMAKIRKMRKRR